MGTWESVAADGSVYESWQESADQVLLGMSYMLDEVDTVVFERMFMKQENGKVFLETQVAGQNENKVVRFMASVLNEHQLSFTNARHDFPKVITYTRINPDSIVAEISGMVQGTQRKHTIAMRRIP
ncbi:MAG: DUF6265 family protein [Chitinophagales bacterium]|nr:DUF6265 family protein [Chitinophagales bacterium]MDW8428274.1 DUF6265 family protein [Chitinophagales bacterium]